MLFHIHRSQKAYDSVSREALWMILQELGVPESRIVSLLHSFYQRMSARIRLSGHAD